MKLLVQQDSLLLLFLHVVGLVPFGFVFAFENCNAFGVEFFGISPFLLLDTFVPLLFEILSRL